MNEQKKVLSSNDEGDELDLLSNKSGSKKEGTDEDEKEKTPKRGDAWDSL